MTVDRLISERHNRFGETPQDNLHDHTIFPPNSEFYPVFQSESLSNQVPPIGEVTHLGGRNPFSADKGLDRILRNLWEEKIPGKRYVEQYLRNQRRRNFRPSTIRHSFTIIRLFLRRIDEWEKEHLEQISREDLARFVEYEQDRGLKASTIRMRLACVKAFIRFLIEGDVVHPEVLSKRMIIKVPDSLPRAMELDDEKRLISVVDDIRNRAMILLLLRTGMRIGELLNTLVRDVNLKERKIEIWEAQKTALAEWYISVTMHLAH